MKTDLLFTNVSCSGLYCNLDTTTAQEQDHMMSTSSCLYFVWCAQYFKTTQHAGLIQTIKEYQHDVKDVKNVI